MFVGLLGQLVCVVLHLLKFLPQVTGVLFCSQLVYQALDLCRVLCDLLDVGAACLDEAAEVLRRGALLCPSVRHDCGRFSWI